MKYAFSFVRWSTRGQGKETSDSRRRQLESAERWTSANGFTLSKEVFIGAGESGFRGKHLSKKDGVALGALARFISAVESGKIVKDSVLCVDSVDRFSRQEILSALEPFTRLLNLGIGIVFTGSYNPTLLTADKVNKEPYLLQLVINEMIRAWSESAEKGRKISEAKKRKLNDILTGKPVPHNNVPKYFSWDKTTNQYTHNEKTKLIRRMIDLLLAGRSLYSIAATFNSEGILTIKENKKWSGNSVSAILTNKTLIGEFLGRPNYLPPVIDKETFDKIQSLLNQNNRFNRGRQAVFENVFRGTAICKNCGSPMTVVTHRKNEYRYLRCSQAGNGKKCGQSYAIRLNQVEEEFFGQFLMSDPKELCADKAERNAIQAQLNQCQFTYNALNKEIGKILEISATVDLPQLKDKLQALQAQIKTVQTEMDNLNRQLANMSISPSNFDDIKKLYNTTDFDLQGDTADYDKAILRMNTTLKDNQIRSKIRMMLPSIVGKIVMDGYSKTFEVFNHSGKSVYKSLDV